MSSLAEPSATLCLEHVLSFYIMRMNLFEQIKESTKFLKALSFKLHIENPNIPCPLSEKPKLKPLFEGHLCFRHLFISRKKPANSRNKYDTQDLSRHNVVLTLSLIRLTDPSTSSPDDAAALKSESEKEARGAKTAENIRYGQGISEQGMGGQTIGNIGSENVDVGIGKQAGGKSGDEK